jgi:hypothetical protein
MERHTKSLRDIRPARFLPSPGGPSFSRNRIVMSSLETCHLHIETVTGGGPSVTCSGLAGLLLCNMELNKCRPTNPMAMMLAKAQYEIDLSSRPRSRAKSTGRNATRLRASSRIRGRTPKLRLIRALGGTQSRPIEPPDHFANLEPSLAHAAYANS